MLTTPQLAILKAAILAETDSAVVTARTPATRDDRVIAAFYNQPSTFYVWKSSVDTETIFDAIDWAKLTVADLASIADSAQVSSAQTNWHLACQGKQINLQIVLQGRQTINATRLKTRQMLTDALQNIPSGVGGALQDAGWVQVKQTLYRPATRGEALFATGNGTTGVPGLLAFEGAVSLDDVSTVLNT
jgi:hypothetical protein